MNRPSIDKFGRIYSGSHRSHHNTLNREFLMEIEKGLNTKIKDVAVLVKTLKKDYETHLHNNIEYEQLKTDLTLNFNLELLNLAKAIRYTMYVMTTPTRRPSLQQEKNLSIKLSAANAEWIHAFPEYVAALPKPN